MGVRWLTTYVKNVERAISSEVELKSKTEEGKRNVEDDKTQRPAFIVDGWAFIFDVWLTYFGESIRSLDYGQFQNTIQKIVGAWIDVGVSVTFVFDGPFLPSKLPTVVTRRAQVAVGNQSFMTSSAKSRISKSFQAGVGVIPPLLHSATIDILRTMQRSGDDVSMRFAPTEADSLVAEIATERTKGYALSQDSDFFVLCSRGQGCSYVPLESLQYLVRAAPEIDPARDGTNPTLESNKSDPSVDDGFQQVSSKKKRGQRKQAAEVVSVPTSFDKVDGNLMAIRFQAFQPHDLASHLQLPPTLMPLFAAIVGNDHTTSLQSNVLLKHVPIDQRISTVAGLLRNEWVRLKNESKVNANNAARRGQNRFAMTSMNDFDDGRSDVGSSATATPTRNTPGAVRHMAASTVVPHDPVRSMVEAVVDKLIVQSEAAFGPTRHHVTTGERELIIDSIIDSAATYSLLTHSDAPHLASPSALFFGEAMTLLASVKHQNEHIAHPIALAKYRDAYHDGHFRESLIEILTQRVFLTKFLPEDVDSPTINVKAARELRQWLYAILFEVWGVSWARKQWTLPVVTNDDDDDDNDDGAESADGPIRFGADRGYREGERPDDVISVDTDSSASEAGLVDDDDDLDDLPSRPASVSEMREEDKPAAGVTEYVRSGTVYSGQPVRIRPLLELLRYGADASVRGELDDDDVHKKHASNQRLPTSLAELLAKHEASQTSLTDSSSADASHSRTRTHAPKSDPAPPPVVMMPLNVRLDLFLHAHEACTSAIKALPIGAWLSAAVLRFLIISEFKRLGGASRRRYNWSRGEIAVAVRSMLPTLLRERATPFSVAESAVSSVYPSTRAIHLSSHVQLTLDTSFMLAQSLLLTSDEQQWAQPHTCFLGHTFHAGMARIHASDDGDGVAGDPQADPSTLLSDADEKMARSVEEAVLEGIEDLLGIDEADLKRERKAQKAAKKRESKAKAAVIDHGRRTGQQGATSSSSNATQNAFAALLEE